MSPIQTLAQLNDYLSECTTDAKVGELIGILKSHPEGVDQWFDGTSALSAAIENRNIKVINALIDSGATMNRWESESNKTPLILACERSSLEIVELLLKAGANPNFPPQTGCSTALIRCTGHSANIDKLKLLLNMGADVNLCSLNLDGAPSASALSFASAMGDLGAVRILLQYGANPNFVFPSGTALSEAVQDGYVEIVRLLLEFGADPNLVYTEPSGFPLGGVLPIEIAKRKKRTAIIELLEGKRREPVVIDSEKLDSWLKKKAKKKGMAFRTGISAAELAEAEKAIGSIPLPLAQILQFANGESPESDGLFTNPSGDRLDENFCLMSLEDIVRESGILATLISHQNSEQWIPFATNGAGDYFCYSRKSDTEHFQLNLFGHEAGAGRWLGALNDWLSQEMK